MKQYIAIVERCNSKCKECIEAFQKDGIPFRPSMCKFCQIGSELHKALCNISESEKRWDAIDWGASNWKNVYNG